MAVVESGTDELSAQVHPDIGFFLQSIPVTADEAECSILYGKGLLQRQLARIDKGVVIKDLHFSSSSSI